ncbi:MAG: class I SAM-dependent methyltransferase [Thermoanaerobaculia bacterium]|nr:class I SAM-dependent methyltransferase [Thermoanaerobaculia bacterium]
MGSEAYGDFAWVYDGPLGKPYAEATRIEIESTVERYLGMKRGPALDLACGTGLSTRLLHRIGFDPVGLDASLSMLAQAKLRNDKLLGADLRALPLGKRFLLVTCLYDSLNHLLEVSDVEQTMAEIARVLDPNGLFLFDINQPSVYPAIWDTAAPFEHREGTTRLQMRTAFDSTTRIATASITGTFSTVLGDFRFSEVRRQRAWRYEEIARAALSAGLRIRSRVDFDPFDQARDSGIGIKWLIAAGG